MNQNTKDTLIVIAILCIAVVGFFILYEASYLTWPEGTMAR